MTPEKSRAARGWLGWSQGDLARQAGVGLSTVKDYEASKRTPIGNNLTALRRAFETAGIQFNEGSISGPMGAAKTDGAPE